MKTEHFWQVLFILVGALASGYAGYWFGNQPDTAATIEYRVDSNNNLHQLMGDTDKLKITYGEDSLDALSNVSYLVANTSKKNLDKVKIYFEMEDKSTLPIFHNVSPPENHPKEAVTLISEKDGVYIFELEYLNRTDSIWGGIGFSFYFGGGEPSKIKVKTGTKGVSIQQYSSGNISTTEIAIKVISEAWWFLLLYIIAGYLVLKFSRTERKARAEIFKKSVALEIAEAEGKEQDEIVNNIFVASKKAPSFMETARSMFKSNDA